ncbi:YggT family protein [Candidatus Paraluminiphilus aquimaris]|jgi:YggT family protein|uniref:YggT family protein n=1 Tax=Candidatus Paraluminiphilus aquimaris TaxID=2518994 RepID=A0ABY6Q5X5_9GAMM|nr:YggT family protein [Candidatus Paraluminiphilus aquimaris]UZP73651.1 YggT family protein [Candidatus Paraluminiphilus aquimaris]
MNSALSDIAVTIASPLFSLALFLIAMRFLAQLCGVSPYNPISTGLRSITDPIVAPINRLVPAGRRLNIGAIIALIVCQVIYIAVMLALISRFDAFNVLQSLIWSTLGAAGLLINIVFYSVLAMIIVSFIAPQSNHPAVEFVWQLTEPVMAPLRNFIPSMGGLDFSPIVLFIGINVIRVSLGHMAVAVGMPAFIIGI